MAESEKEREWPGFAIEQLAILLSRGMLRVPQLWSLLLPSISKRLSGVYLSRLVPIPHLIYVLLDRLSP